MKQSVKSAVVAIIAACGCAEIAVAQPPDVVQSDGNLNTAMGASALLDNTSGFGNTASGAWTLVLNSSGSYNTAIGTESLNYNTTGSENTACGSGALNANQSGSYNTALGQNALLKNTTAYYNTASGYEALASNATGEYNIANGAYALYSNNSGYSNTASGYSALYENTLGTENTATGQNALFQNSTGNGNTAIGIDALYHNGGGSYNIAVGQSAGASTTGSNNIDIGNSGAIGENGIIRIGKSGYQTTTYIAGIENTKITGNAVYVTASGELGVLASSERYKTAITSLGPDSARLQRLRPVTFHLKTDPGGELQYGLIAEEVDKIYPDLVIRDSAGTIQGVRYDELAPLLLTEVQQQRLQFADMQRQLAELKRLNDSMQAALAALQTQNEQVAMR